MQALLMAQDVKKRNKSVGSRNPSGIANRSAKSGLMVLWGDALKRDQERVTARATRIPALAFNSTRRGTPRRYLSDCGLVLDGPPHSTEPAPISGYLPR